MSKKKEEIKVDELVDQALDTDEIIADELDANALAETSESTPIDLKASNLNRLKIIVESDLGSMIVLDPKDVEIAMKSPRIMRVRAKSIALTRTITDINEQEHTATIFI